MRMPSIRTTILAIVVSALGAFQVGCLPPAQFRSEGEFDQSVRAWIPLGTTSAVAATTMSSHGFETNWPDVAPPQGFESADGILVCWQNTDGGFMCYRTWKAIFRLRDDQVSEITTHVDLTAP